MCRIRQTVLFAGTLYLLLGVVLAGDPPVTVAMSDEPVGEAADKTYYDVIDAISPASGHVSVSIFLLAAELGMPGPLSLPTEDGQRYTVIVQVTYANGRSEQVDFVNLADEHARAYTEEEFASQVAQGFALDLGSASDLSGGSLDANVIPGVRCRDLWRFKICYWEIQNGVWKVTVGWRGDGRVYPIIDTGYQQAVWSAVADEPPVTFAEAWEFIRSHAGGAPDVLAQVAAVLEEYAGSYLDSVGVAHPWVE